VDLALGRSLRLAGGDGEVQRKPLDSLGMHLLFKGLEGFSETDLADGVSANFTTSAHYPGGAARRIPSRNIEANSV